MSEAAVLHIKVDPSGAVAGAAAASLAMDRVASAAARSAAATVAMSSAFNGSNLAARNTELMLRAMLKEQHGLAQAYARGSEAVKRYNLQLKIEAVLAEAGVAANTVRGRAIANQVIQLEHLTATNAAAAQSMRAADAAAVATAGGGMNALMMGAMGAMGAVTVLKSTLGDFAASAMEAEENARRLAVAVERKGASFKATAGDLEAMATELEAVTRFEDDAVQKAQAILLRFDEINATNIRAVTEATLDFAQATGQDAASAATAFGKALLEPGEGMRALKEVGVTLTDQQQEMIDTWNKTGQSAKSVALLVGMMNDKIGGEAVESAKTAAGAIDQLSAAFGNLKETLGAGATGDGAVGGLRLVIAAIRGIDESLKSGVGKRLLELASVPVTWSIARTLVDGYKELFGSASEAAVAVKRVGTAATEADPALAKMRATVDGLASGFRAALDGYVERALAEQAEEAKAAAAALQAVMDRVDPVAAAQRRLGEEIEIVSRALAAGGPNAAAYADALAKLKAELVAVGAAAQVVASVIPTIDLAPRGLPDTYGPMTGGSVSVEGIDTAASRYEEAMTQAGESFSASLEQGMTSAVASFAYEFLATGEMNIQRLGDMLLDVLLSAAAEYFAQMVVNQAKLKMESGVTGTNGTSSAMGAVSNVAMAAAVVYAVYAITDGIKKANDAGKYKETAAAGVYRGGVGSTYAGELSAQGREMADALRGFLNQMQSVAGSWITSMDEIGVRVSGDGKKFQAMVGGEIIGTFSSMSEAMVRSFQAAFTDATFASGIDPIIRDMVTNFRGTDIEELKAGLAQVKDVLNEVSGLSDIEIALKDLPFQADAMRQSMVQLGASFDDASALAAKWQATQMGNLRDQITGHQATEAEQRAQKEREALMFNAQLALNIAEIEMRRTKLRADIEILRAGGSLNQAELNLTTQYLGQMGRLTEVKADLLNQDLQIQQGHINLMTAAGQAALSALQLQLAAIDQVFAILGGIKPIDIGEIRLPNVGGGGRPHGGGASAGPSEKQQRAESFLAFLDGLRMDSLSSYQRALEELNDAFAEQAQAASEVEGGEARLAAARRQALADLREEAIDALGSPMEGLRDRLTEIRQRVADWYAANNELGEQFQRGEISLQQLLDALAESNMLWEEMGNAVRSELLNLALYFTDALGDTAESARIREELAEMEWDFKRLEMQMLIETYEKIGWITAAAADHWRGVLDALPENRPGNVNDSAGGSGSLQQAINRLRSAIDGLRKSNENLLLSDVSPLSTADQFAEAQARYNETLALAQSGDIGAIEDFASVRDEYLALAAAMFGTSGAGYQSIFTQSLQAGEDLAAAGQAILDAIPPQMSGVEDRLDTIAEIEAAILAALGGSPANPPGGPGGGGGAPGGPHEPPPRPPGPWGGGGDPGPGPDPNGPPGPPRPGPWGGGDPAAFRQMNANLELLLQATEAQAREVRSDRMMRIPSSGGGARLSQRRGS